MRTFSQLFVGRSDCFGIYKVEGTEGKKQKGRGITYPNSRYPDRRLTNKEWKAHLSGKDMVGIVPVRPDGFCSWFAIDVDDYDLDHQHLVSQVEKLEIPLVVCKSKSGGAHLYCFIEGGIDAKIAVKIASIWAKQLDLGNPEIFPKQTRPEDIGNWIILPYFGGDDAVDYAFGTKGEKLSLSEFEQLANARSLMPEEAPNYLKSKLKPDEEVDIWKEAPPCIVQIRDEGLKAGGRNNFMFHLAVFYKQVDKHKGTDIWLTELQRDNELICDPPLRPDEMENVYKSNAKKEYYYTCNVSPMCDICDKAECMTRLFGIGGPSEYEGVTFDKVIKHNSDPPVYMFFTGSAKIRMSTTEVTNPRQFRNKIFEKTNQLPRLLIQAKHDDVIRALFTNVFEIMDADDILPENIIMETFREWVATQVNLAKDRDDISKRLPYFDGTHVWFRFQDFYSYYGQIHREKMPRNTFSALIKDQGFESSSLRIRNYPTHVWSLPVGDPWWTDEGDF